MSSKPTKNQKIETIIKNLGFNGEGIGASNNFTIFIDGALPGEKVEAIVDEVKKNYGRAHLTDIKAPSPHRAAPPCPFFGKCGGCQIMHLGYNEQLNIKRQRIVDAFERIGKIPNVNVLPCLPSPSAFEYRNKIQIPILPADEGSCKIKFGLYAKKSHDLIEIDKCSIHCSLGEKIWHKIAEILKNSGLTAYDRITGRGLLRHLIIKTALNTSQALVVLVAAASSSQLSAVAASILKACPEVKGVIQNINSNHDNIVLSNEYNVLSGRDRIMEKLCGLKFAISPASFFQVNPHQAENLYNKTLEMAGLSGDEVVFDLFCGVGTLSIIFASKCKEVIGVECVPEAIEDAKRNSNLNEIANVSFVCDRAENWIQNSKKCDLVLLNPPRKGCEQELLERLIELSPPKIIYISCDPATLARDLYCLTTNGYTLKTAQPVDMFPQTSHVECIVSLCK